MSHSTAPYSNIATTRGRPSSADWHNEYKNSANLDSQHFDPSQFFDRDSATRPMKPSPAAMPTSTGASFDPSSYGLGFGLENDASYAGLCGGDSTSTVASSSLGPGGFGLSPAIIRAGAGAATTTNTTPLGNHFAAMNSMVPPKSASMSFVGPGGGLSFGLGPGGFGLDGLGDSNGNGFANSNDYGPGLVGNASDFGLGLNISHQITTTTTTTTATNCGVAPSPYYPPMPALGSGPTFLPPADSWFDPSGAALQLLPTEQPDHVEQQLTSQSHPSDYIGQYAFQDVVGVNDPVAAAAAAAAAAVAEVAEEEEEAQQQELTPKKPSDTSKRSKSTGRKRSAASAKSRTTTAKKKNLQKKPSAKRPRRKSAPAAFSLKDAKSKLGTNDVVMGRGGLSNNHAGNQTFLKLTKSLKPEYARLPKEEKTDVSRRLLKMVQDRGGKFLAKDAASGLFYEVDDKVARRKCSQALREESKAERAERKKRQSLQGAKQPEGDVMVEDDEEE